MAPCAVPFVFRGPVKIRKTGKEVLDLFQISQNSVKHEKNKHTDRAHPAKGAVLIVVGSIPTGGARNFVVKPLLIKGFRRLFIFLLKDNSKLISGYLNIFEYEKDRLRICKRSLLSE